MILLSDERPQADGVAETAQPYVKAEILPAATKTDSAAPASSTASRLRDRRAPDGLLNAPLRINTGVRSSEAKSRSRDRASRRLGDAGHGQLGNFTAGKDPITRNIIVTNNKPAFGEVTKAEVSVPGS